MERMLYGVRFSVRFDRIDEYFDGSYRIIDYKTGLSNRTSWLQDPPQSPQLIIYALCQPNTSSIAFACLHPDQLGYQGYGMHSNDLTGIKPISDIVLQSTEHTEKIYNSWPKQMAIWETAIGHLVRQYRDGARQNNPSDGAKTCQHCHLQPVCRLHDQTTTGV